MRDCIGEYSATPSGMRSDLRRSLEARRVVSQNLLLLRRAAGREAYPGDVFYFTPDSGTLAKLSDKMRRIADRVL